MREVRSIRLFFVITAVLIIACFWMGFSFGKKSQSRIDMAQYEKLIAEQENDTQMPEHGQTTVTEEDSAGNAGKSTTSQDSENEMSSGTNRDQAEDISGQDTDSEEAVNGQTYQTPKFYLKDDGDYLTVYVAATDEVYFETDVKKADLPLELQEDADAGIPFYDLEDLYHFLENYSS